MYLTKEAADRLIPYLTSIRQELHRYPELALEEFQRDTWETTASFDS